MLSTISLTQLYNLNLSFGGPIIGPQVRHPKIEGLNYTSASNEVVLRISNTNIFKIDIPIYKYTPTVIWL